MLRAVTLRKEELGPKICSELINGVIDLAKPSRGDDAKVCHTMDQRNTNEEVDQMDKVRHRLQGCWND
jgi:hypothetical protein